VNPGNRGAGGNIWGWHGKEEQNRSKRKLVPDRAKKGEDGRGKGVSRTPPKKEKRKRTIKPTSPEQKTGKGEDPKTFKS